MNNRIQDLIIKDLHGKPEPHERKELDEWLKEPSNRKYYERLKEIRQYVFAAFLFNEYDPNQAWQRLAENTGIEEKRILRITEVFKYAAAILVILALGAGIILKNRDFTMKEHSRHLIEPGGQIQIQTPEGEIYSADNTNPLIAFLPETEKVLIDRDTFIREVPLAEGYFSISIPNGRHAEVQLPDGSEIKLAAGSSLAFRSDFRESGERKLFLDGEAFFQVKHDPAAPFILGTPIGRITVLGTVFNASSYSGDDYTELVLLSGSVSYRKSPIHSRMLLSPSERLLQEPGRRNPVISTMGEELMQSWQENLLVVENYSLDRVLLKLERHYDQTIEFDPDELNNLMLSGKLELKDSLEAVIQVLCKTFGVEYEQKDNIIQIVKSIN